MEQMVLLEVVTIVIVLLLHLMEGVDRHLGIQFIMVALEGVGMDMAAAVLAQHHLAVAVEMEDALAYQEQHLLMAVAVVVEDFIAVTLLAAQAAVAEVLVVAAEQMLGQQI
jgi:hypothetical protein